MRHELRQPSLVSKLGPKACMASWSPSGSDSMSARRPCSVGGPSEVNRRFARPGTLLTTKLFSLKLTGIPQPVSLGQRRPCSQIGFWESLAAPHALLAARCQAKQRSGYGCQ